MRATAGPPLVTVRDDVLAMLMLATGSQDDELRWTIMNYVSRVDEAAVGETDGIMSNGPGLAADLLMGQPAAEHQAATAATTFG